MRPILSLDTFLEGAQICCSLSYLVTLQILNLLFPSLYIHLEIGFSLYWLLMTFYGQRKWIPLGILDWEMLCVIWLIKLVVSHREVSHLVSMVMSLVEVYYNVCLSVMMFWWDPCWCEPFWCEPYGSFPEMNVMRYVFCLCLFVCLYVYMAFQMVNLATLAAHSL